MCSLCLSAATTSNYPRTLDAAVDTVVHSLELDSRYALGTLTMEELPDHGSPLGAHGRSRLGLDGRNRVLVRRCDCGDDESTIRLVIEAAWRTVQRQYCD